MARRMRFAGVVCVFAASIPLFAQRQVDPRNRYERVLAVVPMIGQGTFDDPKRPMYAPLPSAINPAAPAGILGFTFVASDDGKFALVEIVAKDRSAFQDILADAGVKSFLKGRDKREDAEAEFKKHKKDFNFDLFGVRVQ